MTTPSGDLLRPPSPFISSSSMPVAQSYRKRNKSDFCGQQKIIFQAASEFLTIASQAELSRQRMARATLRRAERSDQSRDRCRRCERAGVSLVQSARGFLRLPPQRSLIQGQEFAVVKDDAPADHDGVNVCTGLGKHHLKQRRAQGNEMRTVEPQEYDIGLVSHRQPADFFKSQDFCRSFRGEAN